MHQSDLAGVKLWINQFNDQQGDRELAKDLIDRLHYVSGTRLVGDLRTSLSASFSQKGVSALFVERELSKTRGEMPPPMYREEKVRIVGRRRYARKAMGAAAPVIKSMRNSSQEIGSEGIIAQALSQHCALNKKSFLLHPSAQEVRKLKVRNFVIVTDFIGSGDRICRMLDSLWRVASVKSWRSGKFVKISVLAFSGTAHGIASVERHRSRPNVQFIMDCPTISNSFDFDKRDRMVDLCERYAKNSARPLGYGEVGSLIAFEHSCPNNAPAILIESIDQIREPWRALFEKRSTAPVFSSQGTPYVWDPQIFFETLGYPTIAQSPAFLRSSNMKKSMYLLLAALSRKRITTTALIRATGFSLQTLGNSLAMAESLGLVENFRLLGVGRKEIARLLRSKVRKLRANIPPLMYYPTALRAPTK